MIFVCGFCEKSFSSYERNRKFCSVNCHSNSRRGKGKEPVWLKKNRGVKPRTRKLYECLVCGKEFESNRVSKYCSKKCWEIRSPKIEYICIICKIAFFDYGSNNRVVCSQNCSSLYKRKRQAGANSSFWKGGKTKQSQILRTRAKYKEWRNSVYQRDNYTCQKCNARSGNGSTVYLHAHHIKLFADYPDLRYEINNGITLCEDCHHLEHKHRF